MIEIRYCPDSEFPGLGWYWWRRDGSRWECGGTIEGCLLGILGGPAHA